MYGGAVSDVGCYKESSAYRVIVKTGGAPTPGALLLPTTICLCKLSYIATVDQIEQSFKLFRA